MKSSNYNAFNVVEGMLTCWNWKEPSKTDIYRFLTSRHYDVIVPLRGIKLDSHQEKAIFWS